MNSIAWSSAACACAKGFGLSLNRGVSKTADFPGGGRRLRGVADRDPDRRGARHQGAGASRASRPWWTGLRSLSSPTITPINIGLRPRSQASRWNGPAARKSRTSLPRPRSKRNGGWRCWPKSRLGAHTRRVMIDFGYSPGVLLNDMRFLGIDPASFDALVLSHGHYDHFGGLVGLLAATKDKFKPGLPLFVGGEDCFCARQVGSSWRRLWRSRPPGDPHLGRSPGDGESPGDGVADHAVTSGQIPLQSSEKPLKATNGTHRPLWRVWLRSGRWSLRRKISGLSFPTISSMKSPPAMFCAIAASWFSTSCSHRGVINTIRQAMAASGVAKLHAVVGGFHLTPPLTDDYVQQTVAEIKAMNLDVLVSAHCSGERFYDMARAEMPGKVMRANLGARVTFGT